MKTYTITLHCTDNPGSSLQAFALQKFLISHQIDNIIIDYRPKYLLNYGNPVKRVLKNFIYYKSQKNKKKKNLNFESQYLVKTDKVFHSKEELSYFIDIDSIYITGSDQIWNMSYPCGNDPSFYLDFANKQSKRLAYAASLGKEEIPDIEVRNILNRISGFEYVSMREKSSTDRFNGLIEKKIEYVCDPVLLHDADFYRRIEKKCIVEPYILVYLVQPSVLLDTLVSYIKGKLQCKVILIYGIRNNVACDKHIRDISPEEFIGYIDNAEYVIASSFHAMVFSHIFKKNFSIVLPRENGARIEQFLALTGLQDRIVKSSSEIQNIVTSVDFDKSDKALELFITNSKSSFLEAINAL